MGRGSSTTAQSGRSEAAWQAEEVDTEPETGSREQLAARYRHWADVEVRGMSPAYERLAHAVADRDQVLDLLLQPHGRWLAWVERLPSAQVGPRVPLDERG